MTKQKPSRRNPGKWMLINVIVTFLVACVLAFAIDGYLLHPIPAHPDGKAHLDTTPYAGVLILDSDSSSSQFFEVFLVEQDGQNHLLYLKNHFPTGRHALTDDVVVDDDATENIRLGKKTAGITVELIDGRIHNTYGGLFAVSSYSTVYILIGFIVTAVESVLFWYLFCRERK